MSASLLPVIPSVDLSLPASIHSVSSPRDPASGLPTGKRQHAPFGIIAILIG